MDTKYGTRGGWLPLIATALLMPALAFCSGGAATAPADVRIEAITGPATVYINEVLAHTDEPQVDSVELYNPNPAPVDLTGWCLSDDQDEPAKFCVAEQQPRSIVDAGGFLVFTGPQLAFGLSEFGEDVHLYAPGPGSLQQVDRIKFGVSPNGVSMGRFVTSAGAVDFPLQSQLTLGAANAGPLVPAVVISELMYEPQQGPEYLVISNNSDQVVELYDPLHPQNSWQVSGIGNNSGAYSLPAQIVLQGGESIVLSADPPAFSAAYPANDARVFGPFAGKLDNDGERIALQAPQPPETNGDVYFADMDVVQYGVGAPWPAAGRAGLPLERVDLRAYGNDPNNWRPGTAGAMPQRVSMLPLVTR